MRDTKDHRGGITTGERDSLLHINTVSHSVTVCRQNVPDDRYSHGALYNNVVGLCGAAYKNERLATSVVSKESKPGFTGLRGYE